MRVRDIIQDSEAMRLERAGLHRLFSHAPSINDY
jgi:hypothetical protein